MARKVPIMHTPAPDNSRMPQPAPSSPERPCATTGTALPASQPRRAPQIERIAGDLLEQRVDAIVNAWNRNLIPYWLLLTQGVSGAIKRRAGTAPFKELRRFGVLPLGAARLTSPGRLPFKGIIHVAGINHLWRSSESSIRECVRGALAIAKRERYQSIAFPAIGSGSSLTFFGRSVAVWGVAPERSLNIIADEAGRSDYPGRVVLVRFRRGA